MRARLVKFNDGSFGVRYGLFFHTYQDFKNLDCAWPIGHKHMVDCRTTMEKASAFFAVTTEKGTVVK